MLTQLSPGVVVNEIENVPSLISNIGAGINAAVVGDFAWGPVDLPVYVNNIKRLTDVFGTPSGDSPTQEQAWFSVHNYLSYDGGGIYVVRSTDDSGEGSTNAVPMEDLSRMIGDDTYASFVKPLVAASDTDIGSAIIQFKETDVSVLHSLTNGMEIYKNVEGNKLLKTDAPGLDWNRADEITNNSYYTIGVTQTKKSDITNETVYSLSSNTEKFKIGNIDRNYSTLNCGHVISSPVTQPKITEFELSYDGGIGSFFVDNYKPGDTPLPVSLLNSKGINPDDFYEYGGDGKNKFVRVNLTPEMVSSLNSSTTDPSAKPLDIILKPINDQISAKNSEVQASITNLQGMDILGHVKDSLLLVETLLHSNESKLNTSFNILENPEGTIGKLLTDILNYNETVALSAESSTQLKAKIQTINKKNIVFNSQRVKTDFLKNKINDIDVNKSYNTDINKITFPKNDLKINYNRDRKGAIDDYVETSTSTTLRSVDDAKLTTKISDISKLNENLDLLKENLSNIKTIYDYLNKEWNKIDTTYNLNLYTNYESFPHPYYNSFEALAAAAPFAAKIINEYKLKINDIPTSSDSSTKPFVVIAKYTEALPDIHKIQKELVKGILSKIKDLKSYINNVYQIMYDTTGTDNSDVSAIKSLLPVLFDSIKSVNGVIGERFDTNLQSKSAINVGKDVLYFDSTKNKFNNKTLEEYVKNDIIPNIKLTDLYPKLLSPINDDLDIIGKENDLANLSGRLSNLQSINKDSTKESDRNTVFGLINADLSNLQCAQSSVKELLVWGTATSIHNNIETIRGQLKTLKSTLTGYLTTLLNIYKSLNEYIKTYNDYKTNNVKRTFNSSLNDYIKSIMDSGKINDVVNFDFRANDIVELYQGTNKVYGIVIKPPTGHKLNKLSTEVPVKIDYYVKRNLKADDHIFKSLEGFIFDSKGNVTETPLNINSPITLSVYLHPDTDKNVKYVALRLSSNTTKSTAIFNIVDGTVVSASSDLSTWNRNIKLAHDGWYRCSITTTLSTDAAISVQGNVSASVHVVPEVFKDQPTSDSFKFIPSSDNFKLHISGLQLEQSNKPTSYKVNDQSKNYVYVGKISSVSDVNYTVTIDRDLDVDEEEIFENDKVYFIDPKMGQENQLLIKNLSNFDPDVSTSAFFAAKYPGKLGNTLKVVVCSGPGYFNDTFVDPDYGTDYKKYFNNIPPGTTPSIKKALGKLVNDQIYIVVMDQYGLITGRKNSMLEKFVCSKANDAIDEYGNTIYYKDYINTNSKYIYVIGKPMDSTWGLSYNTMKEKGKVFGSVKNYIKEFVLGDTVAPKTGNIMTSWKSLKNKELYPFDLVITGGSTIDDESTPTIVNDINDEIVINRQNCVMTVSPPLKTLEGISSEIASNVKDYFASNGVDSLGIESTYVVADSGWKYQYNQYSKKYFWIPLNPDIAGLIARTAKTKGPWHSPAGYNRGKLNHVVKLKWNPDHNDRDILYPEGINPVITETSGAGTILFGDKTRTNVDVSTGKINVRMLFITLENKISNYSRRKLFELNDTYTRNSFKLDVEAYLTSVKMDRGLTDFKVVCDESNNTPEVINSSGFVGDIFIAPPTSINFIQLNFYNTPSGLSFTILE